MLGVIVKNTCPSLIARFLQVAVTMERSKTFYEKFLQESLEETRKQLDELYNEFARSNSVRKQALKLQIDEAKQNIEILSHDLEKYDQGLSWLREASKNRDFKSEHLEKVQVAEAENKPAPQVPARPAAGAQTAPTRPMVGTPVGGTRPTVGKPVVGTPAASQPIPPSKKTPETSKEEKQEST